MIQKDGELVRRAGTALFLTVVALVVVFCGLTPVYGQDEGAFMLEEVTVTAQKRSENQQNVPIAMDVISSEEIQETGSNDISEILSNISGAIVQKSSDGFRISIRGMSDDSSAKNGQASAMPTVAINTDGVYSGRKDNANGLFDIERVEVLYGPQSTMYSSNSPGGIVNIVTAAPKLDTYEASGALEYGNFELLHTEGVMNVPMTEKTALRAAFSTSVRDGYLDNGSDDEDTKSARLRGLYQPNEALSFTVTMELSKDQSTGFGGGVDAFEDESTVPDPWTASDEGVGASDKTSKKIFAQMSWDTPVGAISFVPSYATGDGTSQSTMMDSLTYIETDSEEKSVELRMTSSPDLFFSWIAGVTYYDSEDSSYGVEEGYLEDGVSGGYTDRTMANENKAYFVNVTYPIVEKTRVTVGLRQSWDTMISDNMERRLSMDNDGTYQETPEYLVQENEGEPDWKFGVEYDLGDDSMVYADYATSYRVQGMSGLQTDETEPTRFKVYTLGSKNRFFDNKLQLNGSAYYYDYKNYQADNMMQYWLYDLDGDNDYQGDMGESTSEPAAALGDGTVYGFDIQATAVLTAQDRVDLSLSYLKSEWTKLFFDYSYDYTLVYTEGDAEPHAVTIEDEDYAGKPMMNTPEWTINLSYNHTFNLPNGGSLKAGVNSKFQSGYRLSWRDSDYPLNYQEAHHLEDANLVYNNPDSKWSLSAYMKNIFDYAEKRMYMSMGESGTLTLGNPRTYGMVLSVRY